MPIYRPQLKFRETVAMSIPSPRVTIITVCYNCEDTLADALKSVANQTWPYVEHIVIDGASTDGSMAIIDRYRSGLAKVVSEPDGGIYDAMNKGLQLATGDLVGFLNADDVLAHDRVIADIAEKAVHEAADVVYGDLVYVSSGNLGRVVRSWRSGRFSRRQLSLGWMPPHPTLYVRHTLMRKLGGFDISYKIAADYDLMLRCLREPGVKVSYLPQVLVKMRTGGASNRSIWAIVRKSCEDYSVLSKNRVGGWVTLVCKNIRKLPQFFR